MSTTIRHEMAYDAPVETVAAMLADPAFREEVCRAQHVTKADVTISRDGDALDVVIDQWRPTSGAPSFAKRIVGEETNIVQTEHWSSPTRGEVTLTIPGKPGEMAGTTSLVPVDGGTLATVELSITVRIPLVGGKLESLIGDLLLKALRAEHRTGQAYLSR